MGISTEFPCGISGAGIKHILSNEYFVHVTTSSSGHEIKVC